MSSTSIANQILPFILALIMMGMGMTLTLNDFFRLRKASRSALSILFAQLIILPLAGFLVAIALSLPAGLAIGLVLLSSCPGGTVSNLFSHLARANVALSITLTAAAGVVTIISIPLWVNLSIAIFGEAQQDWQFPILRTMVALFIFTLVPIGIGMLIREYYPSFAKRADAWVSRVSLLFLLLLTVGLIYREYQKFIDYVVEIGFAVVMLNGLAVLSGWCVAKIAKLNFADTSTSLIEVGIQNSAMAMVIASSVLQNSETAIPASVYTAVMYLSGFAVISLRRKNNKIPNNVSSVV